ncbi:MAG: alpha/beta hydrolase [Desulfuromonadales bacterium]|nr:alpha/beta hydrolase [Desulfuromonadales bacterium]
MSRALQIRIFPTRLRTALLLFALVALLGGMKMSGTMEQRLLYFPDPHLVATPAVYDLAYKEVVITTTDNIQLHGWFVPGEKEKPVVLFFHGNAGNISHRLDNIRLLHKIGLNTFIFDYRGFGKSRGRPSEQGVNEDAIAALGWLKSRGWSAENTIYFGRSLGAAVAVNLADRYAPAGLILETPFTSLRDMGRQHYPLLTLTLGWILRDNFNNLEKIRRIKAPLLIFQGDQDAIVPAKMARDLFDAANRPKTFHLIPGAGHNDTYEKGGDAYWQAWRKFCCFTTAS